MKEVKFIGGPFNDRIITLFDEVVKVSIPGEVEYQIRQDENGQWIGELDARH